MASRPSDPLLALLRKVAKDRGLNTAALARAIDEDRTRLKHALSGRDPLTVDQLIRLAEVLQIGPAELGAVPMPAEATDVGPAGAGPTGAEPTGADAPVELGVVDRRGPTLDPITAAADPYGNQPAQALRLALALGCDVYLVLDAAQVQDSGVPRAVLAQHAERLPLRLDAAFHRHHDVRFLPQHVQMTLSFDALYTCVFPWSAVQQVTLFTLPPSDPEPEEEPVEEEVAPLRRGHLRLVE